MTTLIENPADWMPGTVSDLIGPAAVVARALMTKTRRPQRGGVRSLLLGRPGLGKTSINTLGVSVIQIEELDKASNDGAVLMLLYLDRVKAWPHRAVLASSNEDISKLDSRLQSRFQFFDVAAPTAMEIERFLKARCGLPGSKAREISGKCDGDLRAAMLDAQSWLDVARASESLAA